MQFLVRKTHHTTGEVFLDATRAKENETFVVVDAESKEDAKEKVKKPKGLLEVIPSSFNNCRSMSMPIPDRKHATPPRKDSE